MTFFVNLHTLPVGKHMYTAWVSNDPVGEVHDADEIDFVDDAHADRMQLKRVAEETEDFRVGYPGYRVVAIADQSTGEKLWAEEGIPFR